MGYLYRDLPLEMSPQALVPELEELGPLEVRPLEVEWLMASLGSLLVLYRVLEMDDQELELVLRRETQKQELALKFLTRQAERHYQQEYQKQIQ